jgi:hypothetical protein
VPGPRSAGECNEPPAHHEINNQQTDPGTPAPPCPTWCTSHDAYLDSDGSTLHLYCPPMVQIEGEFAGDPMYLDREGDIGYMLWTAQRSALVLRPEPGLICRC